MIDRRIVAMVVIAALLGGAVAALWASGQPDRYQVKVVVAVAPSDDLATDGDVIDVVGSLDRSGITATAAGIATSGSVRDAAATQLGLEARSLSDYEVDALRVLDSNLIDISVSGPDAKLAADVAIASALQLQAQFVEIYDVYKIEVLSEPSGNAESSRPGALLVTVAGALASGAVALAVSWAAFAGRRTRQPAERS